jgi:phosphate-selective porin OprO/OprP
VHIDSRFFIGDDERRATDTTLLRRARPIVEGTLYKIFDFRLMPDFGGGTTVLQDGYLEARFTPALRLRAGKFKPPVGLERLQSATDIVFVERALPTALVPNRDLGLQLSGDLAGGKLSYAVGGFNGVPDGGSGDTDAGDGKELAARLFWRPFQRADGSPSDVDLGLGIAATSGDEQGTPTAPGLPSFRSAGQQSFYTYRSDASAAGTAIADGRHTRLVPQGWLYAGPWGVLGEVVRSEQEVSRGATAAELAHTSWQAAISWVATGERNSYRGVSPRRDFDPKNGGWGAVVLSARVNALEVDSDAFPLFADPARSAREAFAWGAGVSWSLNRGVRLLLDYERTDFEGGAAAGGDRASEQVVFSRFQIAF